MEVARLSLRLGLTAFGGPAAHIAMLRREVVSSRGWLTEQQFLDLLGATNLLPGPNSTEMVMHAGRERAGWRGLVVGGLLFILPATLMVLALAWAYVRYGSLPQVGWVLYGVKPVIVAVVLQALAALLRTAAKGRLLAAIGVGVFALYLLGMNEILLLFGGGFVALSVGQAGRIAGGSTAILPLLGPVPLPGGVAPWLAQRAVGETAGLGVLFLTFLKIGSVLYGSGYVLLAFLRNDFVVRLGWLTDQQLLDAIAVGQLTPGPVFTAATFVGYVVAGVPGAVLATVGIFLPSFVFVALAGPIIRRLRSIPLLSVLLDGVNASAVGLMAAVLVRLAREAVVDPFTALLGAVAAALLVRSSVNSVWLLVGGAAAGVAYRAVSR